MSHPDDVWPRASELARLVSNAQQGVPGALDVLLAALRPAVQRYFARRLASDVAEDLAQGVMIRLTRALNRIDPSRADAYVTTITRNLLRTALRRLTVERRRSAEVELGLIPERRETADLRTEFEELVLAVRRIADADLAPELREIVLCLLRGESLTEIARRQGVSPITVRTRLFRARATLRRGLRDYTRDGRRSAS